MPLYLEKYYPFLFSVAATLVGSKAFSYFPAIKLRYDIFSTTISIASILLGFLVTTLSILFAISSSVIIKELKQLGSYQLITRYLMSAINDSFLSVVINLVALLIPLSSSSIRSPEEIYIFSAWVFFTTLPLVSTYRALRLLGKLIHHYK